MGTRVTNQATFGRKSTVRSPPRAHIEGLEREVNGTNHVARTHINRLEEITL